MTPAPGEADAVEVALELLRRRVEDLVAELRRMGMSENAARAAVDGVGRALGRLPSPRRSLGGS